MVPKSFRGSEIKSRENRTIKIRCTRRRKRKSTFIVWGDHWLIFSFNFVFFKRCGIRSNKIVAMEKAMQLLKLNVRDFRIVKKKKNKTPRGISFQIFWSCSAIMNFFLISIFFFYYTKGEKNVNEKKRIKNSKNQRLKSKSTWRIWFYVVK